MRFILPLRLLPLLLSFIGALDASGARKNVLLIMADDFNHWLPAIGYYPDATTPHLDGLAEKGVLFSRAYSAFPVCIPVPQCAVVGLSSGDHWNHEQRRWLHSGEARFR